MRCGGQSVRAFHAQIHQTQGRKSLYPWMRTAVKWDVRFGLTLGQRHISPSPHAHQSRRLLLLLGKYQFAIWSLAGSCPARTCPKIVNARSAQFIFCNLLLAELWMASQLSPSPERCLMITQFSLRRRGFQNFVWPEMSHCCRVIKTYATPNAAVWDGISWIFTSGQTWSNWTFWANFASIVRKSLQWKNSAVLVGNFLFSYLLSSWIMIQRCLKLITK